jgi:hypothetical protein
VERRQPAGRSFSGVREVGPIEVARKISRVGPPTEVGLIEAPRTVSRVPFDIEAKNQAFRFLSKTKKTPHGALYRAGRKASTVCIDA